MNFTKLALDNDRTLLVAILCVVVGGFFAYQGLPRAEDPGFTVRTAQILTYFPGASPQRMEELVTDKLEEAIRQMPELDTVRSTSRTGISVIYVDFKESYSEMQPIFDDLRRKVESIAPELPSGVIGPYVDDEFGDVFGIVFGVTGDGFTPAELKDVVDDIKDRLLRLPNAGKCQIHGSQDERIFVEVNNSKLAESGLTPFQLQQILASRNVITPGGSVESGPERITLEPSGNFLSVEDVRKTVITLPNGSVQFLEDLASVSRGYVDPPSSMAHINGTPGLVMSVSLREGGDVTALGEEVKATLRELQAVYPIGIEFETLVFQPSIVERKIQEFVSSLVQSVIIVLVVMLIFLGVRTGLVVASLIPVTMLGCMIVMSIFGIGLDQISLASLIIALGMLVDNAIVISESILVQIEAGKTPREAAIASSDELRTSLLSASLTTSAAFLPIFLAKSAVGEYTAAIFQVVTIALLLSWLFALTMIPLLCVSFLRVSKKNTESGAGMIGRLYTRLLLVALRHRLATVTLVVGLFLGSLQLFPLIPFAFFPPADRPLVRAELQLPAGTRIEETESVVSELEAFLLSRSSEAGPVENFSSFIGAGAPRYNLGYAPEAPSPDYAYTMINLRDVEALGPFQAELDRYLLASFPGLRPKATLLSYGPPVNHPVEVRISGTEIDPLMAIVRSVKARLAETPGAKAIDDDWGRPVKKLEVEVNGPRARRAGVSNEEIAVSLQTVLSGLTSTEYREGEKAIPVVIRSPEADRKDLGKIETLSVYSQATGRSVPLKQVADLHLSFEPPRIKRRDQMRTVAVTSELEPGFSSRDVLSQLEPWLEEQQARRWPVGYRFELGGEQEKSAKANASIMEQLPIAGFLIMLLLVSQFNSIRRAAIILLTIPLGIIGVVLGLFVMDSYFGFMTLLGIVSLSGIVINNAIVLLERINQEMAAGLGPQDAVVAAAQARLRPILLTTTTTVGGLFPLLFGGGAMFEPMAIAIMFGLLFGTVLTLGLVPVLYALFFQVRFPKPAG